MVRKFVVSNRRNCHTFHSRPRRFHLKKLAEGGGGMTGTLLPAAPKALNGPFLVCQKLQWYAMVRFFVQKTDNSLWSVYMIYDDLCVHFVPYVFLSRCCMFIVHFFTSLGRIDSLFRGQWRTRRSSMETRLLWRHIVCHSASVSSPCETPLFYHFFCNLQLLKHIEHWNPATCHSCQKLVPQKFSAEQLKGEENTNGSIGSMSNGLTMLDLSLKQHGVFMFGFLTRGNCAFCNWDGLKQNLRCPKTIRDKLRGPLSATFWLGIVIT